MTNELTLSIDGMHCDACVRRVTAALSKVPGVQVDSVQVGSAHIHLDPAVAGVPQVSEAIERIGFHVKPGA